MAGMNKTYNNKAILKAIFFLLLLLMVVIFVLLVIVFRPFGTSNDTYSFDMENLEVTIKSSSTEVRHKVMLDIHVELERGAQSKITTRILEDNISQICNILDYDKVNSRENVQYLSSELNSQLKERFPDEFLSMYIFRLVGDELEIYDESKLEDPYKKKREELFKKIAPIKGED